MSEARGEGVALRTRQHGRGSPIGSWSRQSHRIEPISRSEHPFCDGDRGAVGQLHALSYNLGNFLRTLATPEPIKDWVAEEPAGKLVKIGAKVMRHGRYVVFHMAEVAVPKELFQEILRLIGLYH